MRRRMIGLVLLALVVLGGTGAAGGASQTELSVVILGAETKAGSAAVRWQATPGARVYAEIGLDDEYGVWTRVAKAGKSGSGITRFAGLDPLTTYRFRLIATAPGSQTDAPGSVTTRAIPEWSGATVNV